MLDNMGNGDSLDWGDSLGNASPLNYLEV